MHSRPRGTTVAEVLHSEPPEELVALAAAWLPDASAVILDAIWAGFDKLCEDPNFCEAVASATDDLERGITQQLELAIHDRLSGDEPFNVQHEVPEGESRKRPPARPRAYDIAFIHFGNTRIMWPVEAKVMPPDRPLIEYVKTVSERYLTCDYAPFVSEAAMVGYVLRGAADEALKQVAAGLGVSISPPHLRRTGRRHGVSMHRRHVPVGKPYPTEFSCHHLMMAFPLTVKIEAHCLNPSTPPG